MTMQPDIAELNRIRIQENWSYDRLAREIGPLTGGALCRLIKGETQPSERTQRLVRAFVTERKAKKARRSQ